MYPSGFKGFASQFRDFGLAQAVGRALAGLKLIAKYHALDFYFIELSSLPPLPEDKLPERAALKIRELKAGQWRDFRFAEGLLPAEWMEKQFARNSRLFAVLEGDTIIGMSWINETFADLKHINRPRVTFPKGTVYSYRALVAPVYRNQGIGTFLRRTVLKIMKSEGRQRVFLTTFLKDPRPHSWHRANGFKKWGRVTYVDLRVKDFWWTRLTEEGRRLPDLFHA